MRKITLLSIFLFYINSCIAQQLHKEDFLEDLAYFKTTLPQRHTNLFTKVSEATFNAKVDAIALKADSLNYETFTAALSKLIVAIGDEHTRVEPNYTKVLPIKFEQYKEGIFTIGVDRNYASSLLGRLIAINGQSMEVITMKFKTVIQSENKSYFTVGLLNFLNNPSFLKGLNITDTNDEVTYTLADATGKETKITLKSVPKNENSNIVFTDSYNAMLATKSNDFYWYQYDGTRKILYFNYSKCRENEQKPFDKFNEELFALIEKEKPNKIILDLRNNSGGNSAILDPFIEKIKDNYLNKKQNFFVLIGKKTFSSALMNAVELKKNLSVTLVGETTSGSINHYGEVRGFSLPKTKLTIGYSTKYWENWKGKKGPLQPDVSINYTVNSFKNGKDEALEYIFNLK